MVFALAPALALGCSVVVPGATTGDTDPGEDTGGASPGATTGQSAGSGASDSDTTMGEATSAGPDAGSTSSGSTGAGTTNDGSTNDGSTNDGSTSSGSTGAGTTNDGSTGGSTTEGEGTGEGSTGGVMGDCAEDDPWEPNALPESAPVVPWDETSMWSSYVAISAFLCSGDSDWYRVSVDMLEYEFYALHLDGIVQGSSWCGMGCDEPWLPAAPENTMSVEVYDAETLQLLSDQEAANGRVNIGGSGEAYAKDLLIRVHGPTPAATFAYELVVEIRGYDGEDECEC